MNSKKRKYNKLLNRTKKLLKKYNPCDIQNNTCIKGRKGFESFCCNGCKYLGKNGCQTVCLHCKIWTCEYIEFNNSIKKYFKKINKIYDVAKRYNLLGFMQSKKEVLEDNK